MVQVVSSPQDERQSDNDLQVKFYTNFDSHSIHVRIFVFWFVFSKRNFYIVFFLAGEQKSSFEILCGSQTQ